MEEKDWLNKYCTAYWYALKDDFYFDVDDDDRSFRIRGRIYLNVFGDYGDFSAKLFSETFRYDPTRVGHSRTKTITDKGGDWLKLSFYNKYIPRVNTIAVYENGTYSEEFGRYYAQEKMTVIQLDLQSSATSPVRWEKGANVIVIPKSAFTNTKLNA
ncbi:MAG: hypothetical protein ACTSQG_06930, partial [Promethearchaeota archaeon]